MLIASVLRTHLETFFQEQWAVARGLVTLHNREEKTLTISAHAHMNRWPLPLAFWEEDQFRVSVLWLILFLLYFH